MFSDFHGNSETVTRLREMLTRERFPHAVILAGAEGSGKYTLAQMLAKTMNCTETGSAPSLLGEPEPASELADFCGHCSNCTRIAEADALEARCNEAIEARENLRETDKRETRILIQTHPDVMIIPPDPPQMMIKVDQVRHVIGSIYMRPGEGRRKVYIFTDSAFMKEAANSLLKILEEPPEYATIFLLTDNPGALLPTILSRCVTMRLAPLPVADLEGMLATSRPELNVKQRTLVARLAQGAFGRARTLNLEAYVQARNDALTLLNTALSAQDHSALFRATEGYRAGAEGRTKTDALIATLYALLEDLLLVKSGTSELARNTDLLPQLETMARSAEFDWIARAAHGVDELERGMRRNLLRSLALDSFAVGLEA